MRAIPLDDLERARGDRDQRLGNREEQRAQAGVAHPAGSARPRRARSRRRHAGEIAEVVAAPPMPSSRARESGPGRVLVAADEDLLAAEREPSVAGGSASGRTGRGNETGGRVHGGAARARGGKPEHGAADAAMIGQTARRRPDERRRKAPASADKGTAAAAQPTGGNAGSAIIFVCAQGSYPPWKPNSINLIAAPIDESRAHRRAAEVSLTSK